MLSKQKNKKTKKESTAFQHYLHGVLKVFSRENSPPVIYQDVWSNSQTNHYLIYISLIVLGLPNSMQGRSACFMMKINRFSENRFSISFSLPVTKWRSLQKDFFFYWPFEKLFGDINNYGRINFAHDKLIQGWVCLPHRTKK